MWQVGQLWISYLQSPESTVSLQLQHLPGDILFTDACLFMIIVKEGDLATWGKGKATV